MTFENALKKGLDSLDRSLIRLQERGPPHNRVIEDSQPSQEVQEEHLGRSILEVMYKALSLKHTQGTKALINPRLHGWSRFVTCGY